MLLLLAYLGEQRSKGANSLSSSKSKLTSPSCPNSSSWQASISSSSSRGGDTPSSTTAADSGVGAQRSIRFIGDFDGVQGMISGQFPDLRPGPAPDLLVLAPDLAAGLAHDLLHGLAHDLLLGLAPDLPSGLSSRLPRLKALSGNFKQRPSVIEVPVRPADADADVGVDPDGGVAAKAVPHILQLRPSTIGLLHRGEEETYTALETVVAITLHALVTLATTSPKLPGS
mmetsp:Transcript_64085/g.122264  ORF Transcript_64085/g.122264 Transcript_64085/m.122264 type:complete len:228 (+) Transcript_64085:1024-1707(+)